MNQTNVDVCVAGSGPAGATVARLLAQAGRSVIMADRLTTRTQKFGETLPSAAIRLLNKLGIDLSPFFQSDQKNIAQMSQVGGNLVFWGNDIGIASHALHDPYGFGLRIVRQPFDQLLRNEATKAGSYNISAKIHHIDQQDKFWNIQLDQGQHLRARWVVDATGRRAKLASLLGIPRYRGIPLVALYRTCQPENNQELNRTIISSGQNGWAYAGKILSDQWVIGYHTSQKNAMILSQDHHQWHKNMPNNLYSVLGDLKFGEDIYIHDIRSSWLRQPIGCGWVACGDASLAFDPIAGQGLFNAIYTGMKAANIILDSHSTYHYGTSYTEEMNRIIQIYENRRLSLYRQEQRWQENEFWKEHQTRFDEIDALL